MAKGLLDRSGMKKRRVGSGLTGATQLVYPFAESYRKAVRSRQFLADALPTYPERLLRWRKWAIQVLSKAGRPTTDDFVQVREDGSWEPIDMSSPPSERARVIAGLGYSDDEEERSREWYASRILRLINQELSPLKSARRRNVVGRLKQSADERRLEELASRGRACELGSLIERVRWKFKHEEAALAGYRYKERQSASQRSATRANLLKGEMTAKRIKPLLDKAISRSRIPLQRLRTSEIVRLIRAIDRRAAEVFPASTLRRHIDLMLGREQKKDSISG
jgi:hypothetical protein